MRPRRSRPRLARADRQRVAIPAGNLSYRSTYAALGPPPHARLDAGTPPSARRGDLAAFYGVDPLAYGLAGTALVIAGDALRGEIPWRPRTPAQERADRRDPDRRRARADGRVVGRGRHRSQGNVRFWGDLVGGSGATRTQASVPDPRSVERLLSIQFIPRSWWRPGSIRPSSAATCRAGAPITALLMAAGRLQRRPLAQIADALVGGRHHRRDPSSSPSLESRSWCGIVGALRPRRRSARSSSRSR